MRMTRRDVFKCAACGVSSGLLAGCAAPSTTHARRLRIGILGLPHHVSHELGKAIASCFGNFSNKRTPSIPLEIVYYTIPPLEWYQCLRTSRCGPATTHYGAGLFSEGPSAQMPQLSGSFGNILVRGRTSLGVVYGEPPSHPVPASTDMLRTVGPDIVLSYSVWSYWTAPIASPLVGLHKTYANYFSGIDPSILAHGRFLSVQDGLLADGAPLLRNPMALFVPSGLRGQIGPRHHQWTWRGLMRQFERITPAPSGGGFLAMASFPEGAESALSMVVSEGGVVGRVVGNRIESTPHASAESMGLKLWRRFVHSGAPNWIPEGTPRRSVTLPSMVSITAQHLWSPLWNNRFEWNPTWSCWPLPAGSKGRMVPCTYLCGFINSGSPVGSLAQEFLAFLWGERSQSLLQAAPIGLPLRRQESGSASLVSRQYPWINDVTSVEDARTDMQISDLFGAADQGHLVRTASQVYRAVDHFTSTLRTLQRSRTG